MDGPSRRPTEQCLRSGMPSPSEAPSGGAEALWLLPTGPASGLFESDPPSGRNPKPPLPQQRIYTQNPSSKKTAPSAQEEGAALIMISTIPSQEANRRNPTGGTKASSSASTASIIRSTSGAFITVEQGIPAMAIMVSPLARSNNRATILPGASMLASNPMGWKCQRINWQALGNVTLLKDPLFMLPAFFNRALPFAHVRKEEPSWLYQ